MKSIRAHLRSNVVAYLALFFALSGTAYALGTNTVGSKQIKNGTIQVADISKKARVTLRGARGRAGPAGAQGPQGGQGPQGAQGIPGPTASAFAIENAGAAGEPVPAAPAFMNLLDLNQGASHSGPLTVSFPARIVATATAALGNPGGTGQIVECRLALFPQGGGQQPFGEAARETVAPGEYVTAPMTGAIDVGAGTYDIQVQCSQIGGGSSTVQYGKGNLSVIAPAR